MSTVPKVFSESALLTAAAVATPGSYVCPANVTAIVKKATVCNTDTAARAVTVRAVPSGGSEASATFDIWQARTLQPGESMDIFELENHVLAAGDFISAFADSANKVTMRLSGVEITTP